MIENGTNRRAAGTLVVLTPVVAELAWGSTPITMAWLTLLWMPIYGAGVLLVREAWVRSGRPWVALVPLGLAYELVEDGIGLQALTSPNLYHAADWGVRLLGVNLTYWEANAVYHTVFSVLVPIALVHLAFPSHRGRPFLRTPGTVVTAVVAILGVALLRLAVPPFEDPTYVAPLAVPVTCAVLAALLAVLALRVLPPCRQAAPPAGPVPAPWVLGAGAAVLCGAVLGTTWPAHAEGQPAGTEGLAVLVPMVAGLALAVGGGVAVSRWAARAAWTDGHVRWLLGGLLVAHTLAGTVLWARTGVDVVGLLVLAALTVVLLARLGRRAPAPVPA
ncbi:hypothetical protein GCM10023200_10140 [Actinomycetospora chlora]|uniref:Uncharacterized protein n=1 Tax=Actinomycetospora chlora TaxID=663608 RepID=A0ABP9ACL1_9PSEU